MVVGVASVSAKNESSCSCSGFGIRDKVVWYTYSLSSSAGMSGAVHGFSRKWLKGLLYLAIVEKSIGFINRILGVSCMIDPQKIESTISKF